MSLRWLTFDDDALLVQARRAALCAAGPRAVPVSSPRCRRGRELLDILRGSGLGPSGAAA